MSPEQMDASATAALRSALDSLGVDIQPPSADGKGSDIVTRAPDGSVLRLEIKTAAVPTSEWVAQLREGAGGQTVVVADQIAAGIREDLNSRGVGWLDRRGHLRLIGGGFFIDALVPADQRSPSSASTRPAISGRAGLAAAAALLMHPNEPTAVGTVAAAAGMNPSSISRAMSTLADAQLAEQISRGRYQPLAPELFWILADVWPSARTSLHLSLDDLSDPRLGAHSDNLEAAGWAIGGERGAVSWGAPLVLTGDYPALLYVPDDESIRRAKVIAGEPDPKSENRGRPSVELAVDPIGLLTRSRYQSNTGDAPLSHPVFCALDLAATSRGREVLDQWNPPVGFVRVW